MGSPGVQVIGGGLGGLVAAITAAELGAQVQLVEAHSTVGGRWRTSSSAAGEGAYVFSEGPHVLYRDGPLWPWLAQRGLLGSTAGVPLRALAHFYFRQDGRLRHRPPMALLRVLGSREPAPVEKSYAVWATDRFGVAAARLSAAASGVGLFHPDPGQLSAAFVRERLGRVFSLPPQAGYRRGGWGGLLADLAEHARRLGVRIETGTRATERSDRPTVVATSLSAAAALLGDASLAWPSGEVALLDLGLRADPRDAFVVSDLDGGGWLENFAVPDPSVAPTGCSAVQLQLPIRPGESAPEARNRLEQLADQALPDWRRRLEVRRDAVARGRTGAVDHPGRTWQDRPAVDRGGGVYLVGDQVAAPGLLSEVSFTSGRWAGEWAAGGNSGPTRRPARR